MEPRILPSQPVPSTAGGTKELTGEEAETIRGRMRALDDAGLRRVVGVDADQYRAGALAIAWEEVRARGLPIDPAQAEAERRQHVRPLTLTWAYVYASLLALGTAYWIVLLATQAGAHAGGGLIAISALWLLLSAAVVYGISSRRRWAVVLNDVLLATSVISMVAEGDWFLTLVYAMLWAIPNALYFHRRRELFGR